MIRERIGEVYIKSEMDHDSNSASLYLKLLVPKNIRGIIEKYIEWKLEYVGIFEGDYNEGGTIAIIKD